MLTRSGAGATVLLLIASLAGLAASTGTAQATVVHPGTHARAAGTLKIGIKNTPKGPVVSAPVIRPGKTLFSLTRNGSGGSVEVLRLKPGYSISQAGKDFGKLFSGNVPAIKRVDQNVVFYGGMPTPKTKGTANQFGVDIDKAGLYYVVNVDKNTLTTFRAKGSHQKRALPATHGYLNMKGKESFSVPKTDPHQGWMKTANNATEPHFIVLQQVKESTTLADIKAFFAAGGKGQPAFALPGSTDTLIVGPGHTMVWKYAVPKGKYATLCFWPSKTTGMPHAFMGMYSLLHLV